MFSWVEPDIQRDGEPGTQGLPGGLSTGRWSQKGRTGGWGGSTRGWEGITQLAVLGAQFSVLSTC